MLHRYSLNVLPQLVNVLTGEMTLVGPRPLWPDEIDLVDPGWSAAGFRPGRDSPGLGRVAGLAWRRLRVSRPGLSSGCDGLMPDDAVGVGAVGSGLAGARRLDLRGAVAGLASKRVEDLEHVTQLLQQAGRGWAFPTVREGLSR